MEKPIINKMTFYDVVTLIVPSALVCYSYTWAPIGKPENVLSYVACLGVVLMIGLLLKSVGAWWGGFWFRNNTDIIRQEKIKVGNLGGENISCAFLDTLFFDPIKFLIGPIMKLFYSQDKKELYDYYHKYDIAYAQAYYSKRIEVLESHVAFLQTWIVALLVFFFEISEHKCCVIIAIYVSVILMLAIQRKIYNMIWECKDNKNGERN